MFNKFFDMFDNKSLKAVDPDKFPKNLDKAKAKAEEYANSLTAKKTKDFERVVKVNGEDVIQKYKKICNHSGKYVREESLGIWCENIELYFLGSGYPLYFDFVKSSLIILFLIFVSSGSYNLFSNAFNGADCKDNETIQELVKTKNYNPQDICQLTWTTLLSLANKRNDHSLIFLQDVMNFITVITIVFVLQYLRTNQRVLNEECDELMISPSDYTIWVQGIPKYDENTQIDQKIEEEFNNQIQELYVKEDPKLKDVFKIITVTVCYNLDKINALTNKRAEIIEQIRQFKIKNVTEVNGKPREDYEQELKDIKVQISQLKKEYYDGTNPENNVDFTGHAFITLNTEQAKNILIEQQDVGFSSCCKKNKQLSFNNETVDILPAPEPTDVNWQTLTVTSKQQFLYNILSDIATFFLLAISFVIILGLMRLQSSSSEKKKITDEKGNTVEINELSFSVKLIAMIISLVIPALNYGLQVGLTKLSVFERHHRKTSEIASLGVKLAIAQFINTAVITFIIKVMFDFFDDPQKAEDNIYMNGGLIFNQQYVFITNALVSGASLFVDGGRLFKIFNRKFLAKTDNMTQRQLNALYEEPEHNLAFEYSGLMKTMLFTAFYAPLIPIGIILSIFGIMFLYFIQKYKIINHRTIRYSMSNQLSLEMIELMEYILPVYCLSNIVYEYVLIPDSQVSTYSILAILIGIINIFLPMGTINEILFYVRPCPALKETYNENISNFQFDYDRANPATDEYARKLFIEQEVKQQGSAQNL